nr:hypothetical protein [uncultured Porphyromonas sp.]
MNYRNLCLGALALGLGVLSSCKKDEPQTPSSWLQGTVWEKYEFWPQKGNNEVKGEGAHQRLTFFSADSADYVRHEYEVLKGDLKKTQRKTTLRLHYSLREGNEVAFKLHNPKDPKDIYYFRGVLEEEQKLLKLVIPGDNPTTVYLQRVY